MQRLNRYLVPGAFAAGLIVALECARTLLGGDTQLGGQTLGFLGAVLGVLGLPLFVLGTVLVSAVGGGLAGWRWGRAERAPLDAPRALAWALFLIDVLALEVLATQFATMKFVKLFNKAIYQGLGAGLVAAGVILLALVFAGPAVGVMTRALRWLQGRPPAWADPTTPMGASLWTLVLLFAGAVLAPVVLPELHTVDLRAPRLALLWLVLLGLGWWLVSQWLWGVKSFVAATLGVVAMGAAFAWSAGSLGDSQRRRVALDRDTLLAGKVARQLSRLGDGDGDGVPRLFAGGDCDDSDEKVRPGVFDPPGDGKDQNCTGADLERQDDPLKAPRRPAADPTRPKHNVLLVTVDALRADVVAKHMPRLQALADENVDFTNAYSHGAATYWSLPALMASTMPSRVEMGRDQTPVGRVVFLTELLKDRGWATALFANVTVFFVRGLRQGAQVTDYSTSAFTVHGAKPGAKHMTDQLLKHVDKWKAGKLRVQKERFFAWGHYYDPHDPYFEVPGFPAENGGDQARYEAICRYVDTQLGHLVDGLKQRGVWDDTILIITADHGDEFEDHGHRFHGSTLYEEMTHVPLIMRVPGVKKRRIEGPIGHLEVAPTVAELVGERSPRSWLGRSRAKEILGSETAEEQPVYTEVFPDWNYKAHQVAVREGALKLIYRIRENYFELYDLTADPRERDNVVDTHPQAQRMKRLLLTYADHHLWHLAQGKSGPFKVPGAPPKKKKKKGRKAKKKKRPKPKPKAKPKKPVSPIPGLNRRPGSPRLQAPALAPKTPPKGAGGAAGN